MPENPTTAAQLKVAWIKLSAIAACPQLIIDAYGEHYRSDGTCRCDDPHHPMNEWGYVWDGNRWCATEQDETGSERDELQQFAGEIRRLAEKVERYDAMMNAFNLRNSQIVDPRGTELNDELAPLAGQFADATRDVLAAVPPELLPAPPNARYEVTLTVEVEAETPEQAADVFGFHLAETANHTVTVTNLDTGEVTDAQI